VLYTCVHGVTDNFISSPPTYGACVQRQLRFVVTTNWNQFRTYLDGMWAWNVCTRYALDEFMLMPHHPGLLRPGLVYRAAMEGATYSLAAGLQRFEAAGVPRPSELRLVGGGARNRLWRQMVADVFQLPVRVPAESESAALGAALQAGACVCGVPVADWVLAHPPPLLDHAVSGGWEWKR
jgi:sugar (pentulose or hexulose) kinase